MNILKIIRSHEANKENGITLIVLIITIVILIILSTVTISAVIGENGLINQANLAKEKSEISEAKENAETDIIAWVMSKSINNEDATLTNNTIREILDGKDYVKEANSSSFITKNGEHVILYSDLNIGNIIEEEAGESNGINISDLISGNADNNYTNSIEDLGIPLLTKYPSTENSDITSRRVWDMQLFNNRIYIGSGDYDLNTGPVDVYYYDIETGNFVNEGTLPDEQINRFVIINDTLMIPGTDPQEGWSLGNYYVWEDNAWVKMRNLPGGVHCFDLIEYNGKIFAGLDTESDSTIAMSTDGGETFSYVYMYDESGNLIDVSSSANNSYRVYDLFEFNDSLYAFCNRRLFKYNETENIFERQSGNSIIYGNMLALYYVPLKTKITFNDKFILVNGTLKYTEDLTTYKIVTFDKTTYVHDVIERNGELYFLCNTPIDGEYITSVYKTSNCEDFELVLYYNYTDYALSFEYNDNCFYFGIGTLTLSGDGGSNSGRILKIEL